MAQFKVIPVKVRESGGMRKKEERGRNKKGGAKGTKGTKDGLADTEG